MAMSSPGSEQSPSPLPQEHPLQDLESPNDSKPLESWVDDESLQTSAEGWDAGPANAPYDTPPKNRRLGNWLFGIALGSIAIGAAVLVSRAALYNKSRDAHLRSIAVSIPHAHAVVEGDEQNNEELGTSSHSGSPSEENVANSSSGYEASAEEEVPSPIKVSEQSQSTAAKNRAHTPDPALHVAGRDPDLRKGKKEAEKKELEHSPGGLHTAGTTETGALPGEKTLEKTSEPASNSKEETSKKESAVEKIPLRTPEGTAALERIRQLQARRRALYDRALARHDDHEKEKALGEESKALEKERKNNHHSNNNNKAASLTHKEKEREVEEEAPTKRDSNQDHTSISPVLESGKEIKIDKSWAKESKDHTADDAAYTRWVAQQVIEQQDEAETLLPPPEIPQGMSFEAMRDRAKAANTAAVSAASAAHRAASASALAAEAADEAIHAAQRASKAAARCQSALEVRSVDAVESAYNAAMEAEETASSAVRRAAVGSAKALIGKHDAERKAQTAATAADLSAPQGIVERVSAAVRHGRRQAVAAAHEVENGVVAVGSAGKKTASSVVEKGRGTFEAVRQAVYEAAGTIKENLSSVVNRK